MKISFAFGNFVLVSTNWRRCYVIRTKPLPILLCLIKSAKIGWHNQIRLNIVDSNCKRQTVDVAEKTIYANTTETNSTNTKRNSSYNRLKRQWKICCRQLHMGRDRQSHPKGMDFIKRVRISPYCIQCIYSLTLYALSASADYYFVRRRTLNYLLIASRFHMFILLNSSCYILSVLIYALLAWANLMEILQFSFWFCPIIFEFNSCKEKNEIN